MTQSTSDNPVKRTSALARTYAQSLMELAQAAGPQVVDEVAAELADLVALLRDQPQLKALFDSPAINTAKRAASIEKLFASRVSDLTYRFLQVLNAKGRLDHLATIHAAFDRMLMDSRGEVEVELYTASAMPDAQIQAIAKRIGTALDCKAVVHSRVEPSMIGGLKLRIGDKLIDGSVATRLATLKRQMIDKGREAIRAGSRSMLQ